MNEYDGISEDPGGNNCLGKGPESSYSTRQYLSWQWLEVQLSGRLSPTVPEVALSGVQAIVSRALCTWLPTIGEAEARDHSVRRA